MTTLGELITLQRGYDLPESERRPGIVPVIGSAGITGYHDTVKARGPGVTIGRSGASFGKVSFVREDYWPHNAALFVTDFKGNDPIFTRYLLESLDFSSLNSGSAQQSLNRNFVYGIPVAKTPLPEQRRIAAILSAYDELVENNQRRIRILEEMARALYREWFVELRFPGHQKATSANAGNGALPSGWARSRLGDVAEDVRRNVPKGELEEARPFVGLEHIPRRALALDAWEMVTSLGSNKLEFKRGEILFGKIRPYFHKVSIAPFDGLCSADTIVIRPKRAADFWLVAACVSSDDFVAHASATANGAKMPRASWEVLKEFPIALPPERIAKSFGNLFEGCISQQQVLIHQLRNLRETRDLLLPRLLSGQMTLR
jgi:type I restriction enzyme S subunit